MYCYARVGSLVNLICPILYLKAIINLVYKQLNNSSSWITDFIDFLYKNSKKWQAFDEEYFRKASLFEKQVTNT